MTKTRDLADLGGGFIQAGTGAVQRTVESKLQDMVSVKDFGAVGDGVTDDTAAIQAAILYCYNINSGSNSDKSPILYLGAGTYIVDSLTFDSLRGVRIVGETGNDPVASKSKTKIYWKAGSTEDHLLRIRSCAYLVFSDIFFFANGNSGKSSMIEFECNGNTTVSPQNKFASSGTTFERCCFNTNSLAWTSAAINLKSAAETTFRNCILQGDKAIKIGSDTDAPAGGTGATTVPDGRAAWTYFQRCVFRGDIVRERALGVCYDLCIFAENSVSYDGGSNYRLVNLTVSGNEEVRNEVMQNCGTDVEGITNIGGTFYQSPSSSSPSVPLFTATNNIIQGRGTHFDIRYGKAYLSNNQHFFTNKSGATYTIACRVEGDADVHFSGNDTSSLEGQNTTSLRTKILEDARTDLETDQVVLRKDLAADFTFTLTSAQKILASPTLSQIRAGVYSMSYSVGIDVATTGTYLAYIAVDGVIQKSTYHKVTSDPGQTIRITCPPVLVRLAQTDATTPHEIALYCRQVSAAPFSTINGTTYGTWAQVEYVGL